MQNVPRILLRDFRSSKNQLRKDQSRVIELIESIKMEIDGLTLQEFKHDHQRMRRVFATVRELGDLTYNMTLYLHADSSQPELYANLSNLRNVAYNEESDLWIKGVWAIIHEDLRKTEDLIAISRSYL